MTGDSHDDMRLNVEVTDDQVSQFASQGSSGSTDRRVKRRCSGSHASYDRLCEPGADVAERDRVELAGGRDKPGTLPRSSPRSLRTRAAGHDGIPQR